MASIRRLPSGSYQVQIRRAGMPAVTRSLKKKRDAEAFVRTVEGGSELARKLGRVTAQGSTPELYTPASPGIPPLRAGKAKI